MQIRKAEFSDLPRMMEIYAYARKFMAETGNPNQWGPTNWPPEALIREDIASGHSYVCEEADRIVGVFYYCYGDHIERDYDVIEEGEWAKDMPYGVVHRIAAEGASGVARYCLDWAIQKSGYLRMDTHPDNIVMQHVLERQGFTKRGIIYVQEDDYPRYAYDISWITAE